MKNQEWRLTVKFEGQIALKRRTGNWNFCYFSGFSGIVWDLMDFSGFLGFLGFSGFLFSLWEFFGTVYFSVKIMSTE